MEQFSTSPSVSSISPIFKMFLRMGQSFRTGAHILTSILVLIDPAFCVGSGMGIFQATFCAYTMVINEAPGHHKQIREVLLLSHCSNGIDRNIQAHFNA